PRDGDRRHHPAGFLCLAAAHPRDNRDVVPRHLRVMWIHRCCSSAHRAATRRQAARRGRLAFSGRALRGPASLCRAAADRSASDRDTAAGSVLMFYRLARIVLVSSAVACSSIHPEAIMEAGSFARSGFSALALVYAIGCGAAWAAGPNGTIGAAMPNTKGEWYTPQLYGITDEAKKFGYDVIIQDAGGYANVDKQVTQVSNLIVQRVRAILLDSADPAAFNGVVRQAKEAKIPIIAAGSPTVATDIAPDAGATS